MLKWLLITVFAGIPHTVGVYSDEQLCKNVAERLTERHDGGLEYHCEPFFDTLNQ